MGFILVLSETRLLLPSVLPQNSSRIFTNSKFLGVINFLNTILVFFRATKKLLLVETVIVVPFEIRPFQQAHPIPMLRDSILEKITFFDASNSTISELEYLKSSAI